VLKPCQNPICRTLIEPIASDSGKRAWRRTPRRFCSESCKKDYHALASVAEMLLPLGPARGWEILERLNNRDGQGKAEGKIVNPGVNLSEVS